MLELSNLASDLLVGLSCLDIPEVEYQARMLKELAVEYASPSLAITAHAIEKAAARGDLDSAEIIIPELHERLQQAALLMR